ncbi:MULTISPECIES: hypothetical protein [Campylobacter]|uniref:hypothetical protein n=1 Tax=Campylobacter TaxID=194 RepID=UPI001279A81E|nr:hypothetical protein [Campylobacter lari]MBT0825009.1 hypothetical protein [Campylobacter lari]MBT0828156.1 hypothetical protein [Campylobacter lari]MCR8677348.1 hypothetical protein [Campylobacter sp. S4:11]MCR8685730.1 hypothetical protein [Campylobacter sp. 1569]
MNISNNFQQLFSHNHKSQDKKTSLYDLPFDYLIKQNKKLAEDKMKKYKEELVFNEETKQYEKKMVLDEQSYKEQIKIKLEEQTKEKVNQQLNNKITSKTENLNTVQGSGYDNLKHSTSFWQFKEKQNQKEEKAFNVFSAPIHNA